MEECWARKECISYCKKVFANIIFDIVLMFGNIVLPFINASKESLIWMFGLLYQLGSLWLSAVYHLEHRPGLGLGGVEGFHVVDGGDECGVQAFAP